MNPMDSRCVHLADVRRKRRLAQIGLQSRDEAFQDQRGLAGAGNAGDGDEASFGDREIQGMDRMERAVARRISPCENISSPGISERTRAGLGSRRKGAIREWGFCATSCTVPEQSN